MQQGKAGMKKLDFTFSDLVAGYVTSFDQTNDCFQIKTSDVRVYEIGLTLNTFTEVSRNLGETFRDATGVMRQLLVSGRFVFAYGVFYPDGPS